MVEQSEETAFKGYPEIENHYAKETIKYIEEHTSEELWVATEKIHGTNFCFEYDGENLRFAKRTSYLGATDKFFGF
jgi:hypothetical protein